jgi:hypothetical protein
MNDNIEPTLEDVTEAEPLLVDQLLDKLYAIDLDTLDTQQELVASREGHDWNFFVIPITVLILLAGLSIGLYFESLIGGFIGGAILALLVGYGYHLWDEQWQKAATLAVLSRINDIEGQEGFLHWFKPILAKSAYRAMFYKLNKMHIVDIPMYVRALHRLQEKEREKLRVRMLESHPILVPPPEPTPEPEEDVHEPIVVDLSHGEHEHHDSGQMHDAAHPAHEPTPTHH